MHAWPAWRARVGDAVPAMAASYLGWLIVAVGLIGFNTHV